jgi:gluconate 5-dehydrogenase
MKGLFDLTGKVALLTGSCQGLGLVLARGLGEAGAAIVLNGRNGEKLGKAVDALAKEGLKAHGSLFDVTRAGEIAAAVAAVEKEVGPIQILVNNAGIQRRGPLETFDEETWREILDTNLTGLFLVSKEIGRRMISRRSGKIINVCSLQSELGRPTIAPYTASKGGVKMLTRAMATEWGKHNIQVNGIGPGYFITEMTRALAENEAFDAWLKARTPAARWGDPAELVGTAVYLASKASDFVNGQIVYVDGGILAAL